MNIGSKKHRILKTASGFTLLELLLYVGITAVILLAISILLSVLLQVRIKNQTINEVESQGVQIMQVITQTLRDAQTITTPSTGSANSLTLDVSTASLDPTIFDLSSGILRIKEGTVAAIPLNNNRVTASGLTFQNLSRPQTPGTIRVQFTLTHNNTLGRQEYNYQKTFTTSTTLRHPN